MSYEVMAYEKARLDYSHAETPAEPTDGVRWPAGIGWPSKEDSNGTASAPNGNGGGICAPCAHTPLPPARAKAATDSTVM